jgi:hypothetical protein
MSPEARERSFDELARALANGSISRGRALRWMGAALVGGTLSSLGLGEAAAAPKCRPVGKRCKRNAQCCSQNCTIPAGSRTGTCQTPTATTTETPTTTTSTTTCSGLPNGASCNTSTDCCSGNCSNGFCCESGRVGLSNGTCATPCGPPCDGGPCGFSPCGCLCQRNFCSQFDPNGPFCSDDMECPVGYFCNDNQCQVVCEGAPSG